MIEGNRRETIPLKIFSASGSAKDSITRQWYHLTIPSSRGVGGLSVLRRNGVADQPQAKGRGASSGRPAFRDIVVCVNLLLRPHLARQLNEGNDDYWFFARVPLPFSRPSTFPLTSPNIFLIL